MKIKHHFAFFLIPLLTLAFCGISHGQNGSSIQKAHLLFKQGRYLEAKQIYEQNRRHPGAISFIHKCDLALKQGLGKNKMQVAMQKVVIPNVEFQETPLNLALAHVSQKVLELSGGKAATNIIFRGSKEQSENTTVTFRFTQAVPASEVLKYIAQQSNCSIKYDKYAIVVTPNSTVQTTAAPAKAVEQFDPFEPAGKY